MTVKAILARKGRDVVTVDRDATLASAAKILAERHIGAALILNPDKHIAGVLSERDIVRALAQHGAAALDLPVSEVMTQDVATCTEQQTVEDIMGRMTNGKFRHLPVIGDNLLIGIVSIGDIVKHRVEEMELEAKSLKEYIRTA